MLNEVKVIIFIILTIQLYTPLKTKPSPSDPIIQREKSESAFSAALKGTNPTHKVTKKSGCSKLGCVWVLRSVVRVDLAQHTSF